MSDIEGAEEYRCDGVCGKIIPSRDVTECYLGFHRIGHPTEGTLDMDLHFCGDCLVMVMMRINPERAKEAWRRKRQALREICDG